MLRVCLAIFLCVFGTGCVSQYVLPTAGQVVDIETGTPLAGTFVIATYEVPRIIHGHRCAHGEVTRTDKDFVMQPQIAKLNVVKK